MLFLCLQDTQPQGSVLCSEIVAVEKLVGEKSGKQHCFSLAVAGSRDMMSPGTCKTFGIAFLMLR